MVLGDVEHLISMSYKEKLNERKLLSTQEGMTRMLDINSSHGDNYNTLWYCLFLDYGYLYVFYGSNF